LFFWGCDKEKATLLKDFDINQYIQTYFDSPTEFEIDTLIKLNEAIACLYQKNQYESFWFTDNQPNTQSKQMVNILSQSMEFGLDTILYSLLTIRNFKQGFSQDTLITNHNKLSMLGYELCLTQSAILFFTHLNRGITPFDPLSYITQEDIDSTSSYFEIYNYFEDFSQDSLANILYTAFKGETIEEFVSLMQPKTIHYIRLQKALQDYVRNNSINQDSLQVVYYEKDTVWTTTFDNYRKGCLALQKLRWSSITASHYIFINVPSFTLDFVEGNSLALTHKIICGTIENQTPELNSRLKYIQSFPEWNVPFSIATKEVLPMVLRNINYLARNNYEVLDLKGNILDPDSVPWKKYTEKYFPVRIRQTAGYHNSLGCIKFYFENLTAVYFHDTPAKGLFNKSFRAFSHGCMRLQNPVAFAKAIVEFDKGDWEILQTKLHEKEKHNYILKKNIPIYIRYLTAFCDEDNQLCFAPDFYGRDSVLMQRFNGAVEAIGK
jgi:murein L,D-transpeptidase YcbB/YkuD